jgi:hypothetical protein
MDSDGTHGVASAVDITLLGRFHERFADHAAEIRRRVVFQVTGQPPWSCSPRDGPHGLELLVNAAQDVRQHDHCIGGDLCFTATEIRRVLDAVGQLPWPAGHCHVD